MSIYDYDPDTGEHRGERARALARTARQPAARYPAPTVPAPSGDDLLGMLQAAVMDTQTSFGTSDGCEAEADGTCPHGHPTWLVRARLM